MNIYLCRFAVKVKKKIRQNQKSRKQKSPFTPEEDARLKELVAEKGDRQWNVIQGLMPGRNARQCRERWRNYLSPEVKNGPWTKEEDEIPEFVKELLQKYPGYPALYIDSKGGVFTEDAQPNWVKDAILYQNPYYKQ